MARGSYKALDHSKTLGDQHAFPGDMRGWKGKNVEHRGITVNKNSMVECCDISSRSSNFKL